MAVYRSPNSNLRISFPPEEWGMGEDIYGKPAPFQNVKFKNGEFRTNKESLIERMSKHLANQANGGMKQAFFYEEKETDTAGIAALSGDPIAFIPNGGISPEDHNDINLLHECSEKFSAPRRKELIGVLTRVLTRFKVQGITKPSEDIKVVRLKARIVETLGLLEDLAIITKE